MTPWHLIIIACRAVSSLGLGSSATDDTLPVLTVLYQKRIFSHWKKLNNLSLIKLINQVFKP
jgi:hypothetical protein